MKKADMKKHEDEVRSGRKFCYAAFVNAGFQGDDKCDNYGYLGDRLVKIDYAQ